MNRTNSKNVNINNATRRMSNLRIISKNVNSVIAIQRRQDLTNFTNKNNPDIVLLGKTKLNLKHKIALKNYTIVRNDRLKNRRGGGTAIVVKNTIKVQTINLINRHKLIILEISVIKINLQNNKNLLVISA